MKNIPLANTFNFIKKYGLFFIYLSMLIGLFYGVYLDSGLKYFNYLSVYFGTFVISYIIFSIITNKFKILNFDYLINGFINEKWKRNIEYILLFFITIVIIIHYIDIGFIPIIKAIYSTDYYEIVNIRKEATLLSVRFNRYLSSFVIKAILPFLLLFFLHRKKYLFYFLLLFVGLFYAASLMQKSFVLTVILPSLIYAIFYKKWFISIFNIVCIFGYIYALLYITNPSLRNIEIPEEVLNQPALKDEFLNENDEISKERRKKFYYAIYKRVVLLPGGMVSKWFENIPKNEPFLYGCGYRFLTPFLECEYHNYGQELYDDIYPKYAARGIKGNANSTNFMYDYANFGMIGLALAGVFMGILIAFIDYLFMFNLVYKTSINTFYILMLSSSSVTTLLFSGGWGLIIFLFFLYISDFNKNDKT